MLSQFRDKFRRKCSGMSISSKKGFQQSPPANERLIVVDESKKQSQWFIDKQNAHMAWRGKNSIDAGYWIVQPYIPTPEPKNRKCQRKKKGTGWKHGGEEKNGAGSCLSEKNPKMFMQQLRQNQMGTWCWSLLHSRWSWWIWCPFFLWVSFSEV